MSLGAESMCGNGLSYQCPLVALIPQLGDLEVGNLCMAFLYWLGGYQTPDIMLFLQSCGQLPTFLLVPLEFSYVCFLCHF